MPENNVPYLIILLFKLLVVFLLGVIVLLANSTFDKVYPGKAKKLTLFLFLGLLGWLLFLAILSQTGFLNQWQIMPPRLLMVVIPPLIAVLLFCLSEKANKIIENMPQEALTGIQSFRIVMELILFWRYIKNIIPVQMTFEGRNCDLLSGISAIPVAYFIYRKQFGKMKILIWNITCLLLLANIVITAFLSVPTPLRMFINEPSNTIIAYYPFVWLPGFVVPVAYTLHFLSIKKCLLHKTV